MTTLVPCLLIGAIGLAAGLILGAGGVLLVAWWLREDLQQDWELWP
jgi:hypothetical protein